MTVRAPTSFATAIVAVGAALGAGTRWGIAAAMAVDGSYPWPTLVVNVIGCFVVGMLAGAPRTLVLGLGVGFAGGLTTFSTFSLEIAALLRAGDGVTAVAHVVASLVLGLGAAVIGRRMASA